MTRILSEHDEEKMKEVLKETMDQYIKRTRFWDNEPKQELKPLIIRPKMTEITKDERIKALEELIRKKIDLIDIWKRKLKS